MPISNGREVGKVLRISDLTVTTSVIRDRIFEDCLILGPAVLALVGSTLEECIFDGDVDALLWEIPPERLQIIGAIQMENCTFLRCRFQMIGFAGPKDFAELFRSQIQIAAS
ncbi:hypothetical protein [Pseudarthrobacter sp. WHRI 8279]|uniref:hypothetical protein n=1 Tax=Pseudarthrobacter sp. WHRI 8279 TaxID=3162566 RepID=UPI0032EAEFCC